VLPIVGQGIGGVERFGALDDVCLRSGGILGPPDRLDGVLQIRDVDDRVAAIGQCLAFFGEVFPRGLSVGFARLAGWG
jgi:hypothetical protein